MPVRELLDKIDHGLSWMVRGKDGAQPGAPRQRRPRNFKVISILALIALVVQTGLLIIALTKPGLPYRVSRSPAERLDDARFVQTLQALTGAHFHRYSKLQVLTNGDQFYEAELAAIAAARRTINIEAYIFAKGEVTQRFVKALAERARAGVRVQMVVDAIGTTRLTKDYFKELTDAKGEVEWYHPLKWHTWPDMNNRTHRELLIVDGSVGFIGGAGFADHWYKAEDAPRWRDTMVRVEGEAVTGLQSVFAENWLEASGEIISGPDYFPFRRADGNTTTLVIGSAPTVGGSTTARVLFQTLIASASKTIYITTPYFLPDYSARSELVRAIRERSVEVKIVVPGMHMDHHMTRSSSRRLYGDLLQAGAKIFEYKPSMIHTKSLVVDGMWSVLGSTNFDSRSFTHNVEVNIAVLDPAFAKRVQEDFFRDMSQGREITYEEWKRRPQIERANEYFGWLLERQQ